MIPDCHVQLHNPIRIRIPKVSVPVRVFDGIGGIGRNPNEGGSRGVTLFA